MANSSTVRSRMNTDLKEKAEAILHAVGLTSSEAIRILYTRIVNERSFPAALVKPTPELLEAMEEAEQILRKDSASDSIEDMFASLDEKAGVKKQKTEAVKRPKTGAVAA